MQLPAAAGGVFEAVLGAVAPLLIAGSLVCVVLFAVLGSIVIFANDVGTRNLQGAGAFALCFGFASLLRISVGLWIC